MGKASSNKKVARVARTGGGRTAKGSNTSWFWPVFIGIVVVLGTAGIVYSKDQRQVDTSRPRPAEDGRPQDHWHAALGIYVCDRFLPPITDQTDPSGIHTHGDGVVHIHPFSEVAAGERATLGAFFSSIKANVSSSEIAIPGMETQKNGKKCGDKEAVIQTKVWPDKNPDTPGSIFDGNPSNLRLKDRQLITIALVPEGADIPRPESTDTLDNLSDVDPPPGTDPSASTPLDAAPPETAPPETAPPDPQPPPP